MDAKVNVYGMLTCILANTTSMPEVHGTEPSEGGVRVPEVPHEERQGSGVDHEKDLARARGYKALLEREKVERMQEDAAGYQRDLEQCDADIRKALLGLAQ